jgi:hypothetical protein
MPASLIIGVLNVRSSYRRGVEEPLDGGGAPDTVQWWLEDGNAWRVRSFAADHEMHALLYGQYRRGDERWFADGIRTGYGALLESLHTVKLKTTEPELAARALRRAGLAPWLELTPPGFAFWNPDRARYQTTLQHL